jgi:hypothetical protein
MAEEKMQRRSFASKGKNLRSAPKKKPPMFQTLPNVPKTTPPDRSGKTDYAPKGVATREGKTPSIPPTARKTWTDTSPIDVAKNLGKSKPAASATPPAAAPKAKPAASSSSKAFPVYKKDSAQAKSFREAFAAARKKGLKTFPWEGRTYSTAKKK